ncbi:hypothetical protein FGIG_07369 [Fasciola gigantica]|uniref:Uncharacterized protein n=1 Tax=Fasciola gigantica TaxID=46835 RepID=A0A504Y9H8_FASGI|nr:hypothetical protein FGIG_07369 [Fasciola gigantica]
MEGNEFIANVEPGSGQDVNSPLTDIPCDLSPTYSLEDGVSCVGSLDAAMSISSCEPFPVTRISPPVVGRTVSTTSTTNAVEYSSLTTSQMCSSIGIEPGDSGFSSWTGVAESHSHFSPTLARLDSESHQGSDESNAPNRMPSLSVDGTVDLGSLYCANAINEELCDRMFVHELTGPESARCLASGIAHAAPWISDDNQNQRDSQIPISPTNVTSETPWNSLITPMNSSPLHPETNFSSFRPVKFFEASNVHSHGSSSTSLTRTKHQPNECNFMGTASTTSCVCHRPLGHRRPDSAPVQISPSTSSQVGFSIYDTDSESVGEQTDDAAPIDTADDGDDEGDAENTPTSHRRRGKYHRNRPYRNSFSGRSQSPLVHSTQMCLERFPRVHLQCVDVPVHGTHPCAGTLLCMHEQTSSRGDFRIDPSWIRRSRDAHPSLPYPSSVAPQNATHELGVYDDSSVHTADPFRAHLYHCGSLMRNGAVMHLFPPMPDVVPQDSHLVRVCSLRHGFTTITSPNLSQRANPVRPNSSIPPARCASVPVGPTETTRLCSVRSCWPNCTESWCSAYNRDWIDNSWNIPPTQVTTTTTNNYNSNISNNVEYRAHGNVRVSYSTAGGPAHSDSTGLLHDQLYLLARRMAHIGDELTAQGTVRCRTRHSLPSDRLLSAAHSNHRVTHSLWDLSASLASLVTAPFDYVHRIIQLAGQSLSSASNWAEYLSVPTDTTYQSVHQRRRARTYTGTHHHYHSHHPSRIDRVAIPTIPVHEPTCEGLARGWPIPSVHMARTSTPNVISARRPTTPDSSCVHTTSPIDETRTTDYIFHFD